MATLLRAQQRAVEVHLLLSGESVFIDKAGLFIVNPNRLNSCITSVSRSTNWVLFTVALPLSTKESNLQEEVVQF